MMKPQTKRSFCLGVFLVIVTLVVLYSYCNGNSVCYTFPLFSGLERDRLDKRPQAEVVVTSVIVQTKRPFNMGAIPEQHKGICGIQNHGNPGAGSLREAGELRTGREIPKVAGTGRNRKNFATRGKQKAREIKSAGKMAARKFPSRLAPNLYTAIRDDLIFVAAYSLLMVRSGNLVMTHAHEDRVA